MQKTGDATPQRLRVILNDGCMASRMEVCIFVCIAVYRQLSIALADWLPGPKCGGTKHTF